jgi:hypothetical protein
MMANVVILPELRLKLKGPMRLRLRVRSELAGNSLSSCRVSVKLYGAIQDYVEQSQIESEFCLFYEDTLGWSCTWS